MCFRKHAGGNLRLLGALGCSPGHKVAQEGGSRAQVNVRYHDQAAL